MTAEVETVPGTVLDEQTMQELQPPCDARSSVTKKPCPNPAEWISRVRCTRCAVEITRLNCDACLHHAFRGTMKHADCGESTILLLSSERLR